MGSSPRVSPCPAGPEPVAPVPSAPASRHTLQSVPTEESSLKSRTPFTLADSAESHVIVAVLPAGTGPSSHRCKTQRLRQRHETRWALLPKIPVPTVTPEKDRQRCPCGITSGLTPAPFLVHTRSTITNSSTRYFTKGK